MKTRQDILNHAKSLIGYTNYKLGAKWHNSNNNTNKPKLLDCSGFVVWAYKMAGFSVADGTYYQWQSSDGILKNELKIGDIGILEYGGTGTYNHIGLYAGDGYWIHCSYGRNGVVIEKTNIFKYYRRFSNTVFEDDKTQANKTKDDKKTSTSKPNTRIQDNIEDEELIEQKEFIVNGKKMKLYTIFKNNRNYVSLQSLKEANVLDASYDSINKIAIINNK